MATRDEWKRYYIGWVAGSLDAGDLDDVGIDVKDLSDAEIARAEAGKRAAVDSMYRLMGRGAFQATPEGYVRLT